MKRSLLFAAAIFAAWMLLPGCSDHDGGSTGPGTTIPNGAGVWDCVDPLPTGNTLYSPFFLDETAGWIVGAKGTILHTTDGGATWDRQTSGTNDDLKSVFFTDSQNGWAVGGFIGYREGGIEEYLYQGVVVHTSNGGQTWTPLNVESHGPFYRVKFINSQEGWISGVFGQLLHTADGGNSWLSLYTGDGAELHGLSFTDSDHGWIAEQNRVARTTDGGLTWETQNPGEDVMLNDILMTDSLTGWVVGYSWRNGAGEIFHTTDGGTTWTEQGWGSGEWTGIASRDGQTVVVAGISGGALVTTNGGATWQGVSAHSAYPLNGVAFSGSQGVWAVGNNGQISYSYDDGGNWTSRTQRTVSGRVYDAVLLDTQTGFAVGNNGLMTRTEDGGATWTALPIVTQADLYRIVFLNADQGWAVGGDYGYAMVLKTVDGGANWTVTSLPGFQPLRDVAFENSLNGWAVGDYGTILHTTDGGANWSLQTGETTVSLISVSCLSESCVRIIGGNQYSYSSTVILRTSDGGETWLSQPLSGIYNLTDAAFPTALDGWIVGGNGLIVHTADGGEHWAVQNCGIRLDLAGVSFMDRFTGWVVARDGVVLHTSDGGASWAIEASGTNQDLYGIHCRDHQNGLAVGDGVILSYRPLS